MADVGRSRTSATAHGIDLRGWDDTFDEGMRASIGVIIDAAYRGPKEIGWMRTRWWQRRAMRRYGYLFHAALAQAHANRTWSRLDPPRPSANARSQTGG